jgi:hypothetical protein
MLFHVKQNRKASWRKLGLFHVKQIKLFHVKQSIIADVEA